MFRLLIALCLLPSFALADKWTKTTRKDKMYDFTYDVIENSNRTVSVVCSNGNATVLIDYKQYVGFYGDADFIFRLDSQEPVEWTLSEADSTVAIKKNAHYFVQGLVNSKKIATRVKSEYVFAEKTIDATGFAAAYNTSKSCRQAIDDWKVEYEQPEEDANFELVAASDEVLVFVDNSYFDPKESSAWVLQYNRKANQNDNSIGSKGLLSKEQFDCKKRANRQKHAAFYDEYGKFLEGVSLNKSFIPAKPNTIGEDIIIYACENKIITEYAEYGVFNSVKSAFEFGKTYGLEASKPKENTSVPPIPEIAIKCSDADSTPTPITSFNTSIAYPTRALEEEIDGMVSITSLISADGNVTSSSISATNPLFNSSSVVAEAKRQKYKPARISCKNVAGTYTYTVKFKAK